MDRALSTVLSSMRRGLTCDTSMRMFKLTDLFSDESDNERGVDDIVDTLVALLERVRQASESLIKGAVIFCHSDCEFKDMHAYLRCPMDRCTVRGVLFYLET
mgnify:CR=1 FL=1